MSDKVKLKELYHEAYLKWVDILDVENRISIGEPCSFCREAVFRDKSCGGCLIDRSLCNRTGRSGLYAEITTARLLYIELVAKMVCELKKRS